MMHLLKLPGFVVFMAVVFLNAFVDLGHKMVLQNTVFLVFDGSLRIALGAVLNALILLPFVLLLTPAGVVSDRYSKPRVLRGAAAAGVVLTLLSALCYHLGLFWFAFALTLLFGIQTAIYSPAKYGYIRELVGVSRLTSANGVVQAVSTVALLASVVFFSVLFARSVAERIPLDAADALIGSARLGWWLVGCAVLELLLAWRLPARPAGAPELRLDLARYRRGAYLGATLRAVRERESTWLSILGLAVFWAIAQVVIAVYPAYAEQTLGVRDAGVVQGLLACAGCGVVAGALLAARWSRDHIETGFVPIGALGVSGALLAIPSFGSLPTQALALLALGVCGGLFVTPLNALIQYNAAEHERGRILAASNFVQSGLMLVFLALTTLLALRGIASRSLFVVLLLIAFGGALFTIYKLPHALVRIIASLVITQRYRIEVIGFDRIPQQGGVLLLGNHVSWIDWAVLQIAAPRPIRFVMERGLYERWYLKWFLDSFGVIPIGRSASRDALAEVRSALDGGEVVGIFPEGAISRSGHLGEFRRGYETAARDAHGVIVPFYLRGLWGSTFSRSSARLRTLRRGGMRRTIICAFGTPQPLSLTAEQVKQRVFELSIEAWELHTKRLETIPSAWLTTAKRMGGDLVCADTVSGALSGWRFLTGVILISRRIRVICRERNVGLLLPTSGGGAIANLAALLCGKVVVNLNYTASVEATQAAIAKAGLRTIVSSSRFLERLATRGIDGEALVAGTTVHYLEDFRDQISATQRVTTLLQAVLLPAWLLKLLYMKRVRLDDPAAILFSSGSEGKPKGVVLSHRNIIANIKQISDVLNTEDNDVLMATLPLFHAFGLTAATLMPLVEGIPVICHPDPTDAVAIGKAVAEYRGTVLFGTSTFLRLYARNPRVHPLMFDSLRIVVAGAEKLAHDVREAFKIKFGKEIYEGYGATETTPVASANLPDRLDTTFWTVQVNNKPGTVGMALPGSSFRIVDPTSLTKLPTGTDGLILIGGTQVMLGYLDDPERTAEAIVEIDGTRWYKTGDKGHLDADGFLTIVDRYSRFAKLGGEMVSLTAVEDQIRRVLGDPELDVCAMSVPDAKKGEQIVLLIAGTTTDGSAIRRALIAAAANPLTIPAQYREVQEIPKLGSGKTDFARARALALEVL